MKLLVAVLAIRHCNQVSTSIKVAGGISDPAAQALAPDMHTTADFLISLKKTHESLQFEAYIRNQSDCAVSINVLFGVLEEQPRKTAAQHAVLIARYSAETGAPPEEFIVNFNSRPPEMEPWRLDSADKKPAPPHSPTTIPTPHR